MKEEMEYVHHPLEQAVHSLACLATPITRMPGLVDNLYKDAEEQIGALMKEHKALGIIKKHARDIKHFKYLLYMAKYWEENEIEVTEELLYNYDFPYTVDEFNLLKEELK